MVINTPCTACIATGAMILLLLLVSAGCVTIGENAGTNVPVTTVTPSPARQVSHSPTPGISLHPTGEVSAIVKETAPVVSNTSVNLTPRTTQEDSPGLNGSRELTEVYSRKYPGMKTESHALLVNVTRAPWAVGFSVVPRFDNPWDSFLVVTVRDAATMEIVEEEGFGRQYSSEPEKEIRIYAPGVYHVNLEGSQIDLTVTIRTSDPPGSVPVPTQGQKLPPTRPAGMPIEQWIALQKGR